jgi:sulfopyruvate decarboxylase TPP-binding subunit
MEMWLKPHSFRFQTSSHLQYPRTLKLSHRTVNTFLSVPASVPNGSLYPVLLDHLRHSTRKFKYRLEAWD